MKRRFLGLAWRLWEIIDRGCAEESASFLFVDYTVQNQYNESITS
jgi:hypothetical protein